MVGLSGAMAGFLACATAPERGFSPLVIEPPRPYSKGREAAAPTPLPAPGVSRLYLRPEPGPEAWPMIENAGVGYRFGVEEGIVSWYGYDHIGRRTATGTWFNPEGMTAAHKSLPFGTLVRVTRLDTSESVEVTINDRGPYVDGRIIDLARKPARKLDLIGRGIAPCRVEVLRYPLVELGGPTGR